MTSPALTSPVLPRPALTSPALTGRAPTRRAPAVAAALLAAAGLLTGGCAASPPPAPATSPAAAQLRVGLVEWGFVTSVPALLAGPVRLHVTNAGSTAHDLHVLAGDRELAATAVLPVGATQDLAFDVSGLRAVRFVCNLPGHEAQGMVRDVAVVPAGSTAPVTGAPTSEEAPS